MRVIVLNLVGICLGVAACTSNNVTSVASDAGGSDAGGAAGASQRSSAQKGGEHSAGGSSNQASSERDLAQGGTSGGSSGSDTASTVGGDTALSSGGASASGSITTPGCDPDSCNKPPDAGCEDTATQYAYAEKGTCNNGACEYQKAVQACVSGASCNTGKCECNVGLTQCSSDCVDTQTSPDHCGTCGHSCLGGDCKAGRCMPKILAPGQSDTWDLAINDTHLYWARGTSIFRVLKAGGDVEPFIVNQTNMRSVLIDGENLYFAGTAATPPGQVMPVGQIKRAALATGDYDEVASHGATVLDMAVMGNWLYYVDSSNVVGGTTYIRRIAKTGGTFEPVVTSANSIDEIKVSGECVFYRRSGLHDLAYVCPNTEGPIGAVGGVRRGIAADKAWLYFADDEGVKRRSFADGTISLLTEDTHAGDLAVDDANVYYVSGQAAERACGGDWRLYRLPKSGGTPSLLVDSPLYCPGKLVVDERAVYYRDESGDQPIWYVAK